MARSAKPCPICGKPATADHTPFCSDRCKQVDLNRWLHGGYVISSGEADDPADGLPEDFTEGGDGTPPTQTGETRH
ncbi:MAG: DNA gyrase inhibitor YacG [Devosiaceae bacterium]|nr:DNA gyrase inhibitor YacG [Devosiaceae bacterium MH13]